MMIHDGEVTLAGAVTSSPGSLLPPEMNARKAGGARYLKSRGHRHSIDTTLMNVGRLTKTVLYCPRVSV